MRVTTDLWVSALTRRVFATGGFAAIVKRGATEAGAVFILSRNRGEVALFGPAAQASYDMAKPDERCFQRVGEDSDEAALDAKLEREKRFDPDLWILELEPGNTPVEELIAVTTP